MSKKQPTYTEEYKKQIVNLYKSGKAISEIIKEYGMARATIYNWVGYEKKIGSFRAADNRSEEENELIRLRKENKRLQMEVDILKQAALIMGKK